MKRTAAHKKNGKATGSPFDIDAVRKNVVRKIKSITPEERFETLVDSGICTIDGKLASEYRG